MAGDRQWCRGPSVAPISEPSIVGRRPAGTCSVVKCDAPIPLLAPFLTLRQDMAGDVVPFHRSPFDLEAAAVTEKRAPHGVSHAHADPESAHLVVVPLADVGNPTKCHREPEADQAFIELGGPGTRAEASLIIDREIDVDGQMLVRAEIVDNPALTFAVDHVGVEPPSPTRLKRPDPGNGFPAELVDESIVLDREWDIAARFRKHDPPPGSDIEEWDRVEPAFPDFVHRASSDARDPVGARKAEAALDLRMETIEVGAKRSPIDGDHVVSSGGFRWQRAADGRRPSTSRSMAARQATARFSETGLNAASRNRGEFTATTTTARNMRPRHNQDGHRRCQKIRSARANPTSARPSILNITSMLSAATPESSSIATSSRCAASNFRARA